MCGADPHTGVFGDLACGALTVRADEGVIYMEHGLGPHGLLANHVHMCVLDDGIVFLDARANRYVALGREHLPALVAQLRGLSAAVDIYQQPQASRTTPRQDLLVALESKGLVTRDVSKGRACVPPTLLAVDIARSFEIPSLDPDIRIGDTCKFGWAALRARIALRTRSLESIVQDLSGEGCGRASLRSDEDPARIGARFRHLRRFAFPTRDNCLFAALVLTYFMRSYGIRPRFVIGLRSNPFRAHCWVQHGNIAFDNRPDRLGRYTPIMVV